MKKYPLNDLDNDTLPPVIEDFVIFGALFREQCMNCVFRGQHIKGRQDWLSTLVVDSYIGAMKSMSSGAVYTGPQGAGRKVVTNPTHKFIRVEASCNR